MASYLDDKILEENSNATRISVTELDKAFSDHLPPSSKQSSRSYTKSDSKSSAVKTSKEEFYLHPESLWDEDSISSLTSRIIKSPTKVEAMHVLQSILMEQRSRSTGLDKMWKDKHEKKVNELDAKFAALITEVTNASKLIVDTSDKLMRMEPKIIKTGQKLSSLSNVLRMGGMLLEDTRRSTFITDAGIRELLAGQLDEDFNSGLESQEIYERLIARYGMLVIE